MKAAVIRSFLEVATTRSGGLRGEQDRNRQVGKSSGTEIGSNVSFFGAASTISDIIGS
jgi:hypothetical protein